MTSVERIKATANFEVTDRAPVFTHIFGWAARLIDLSLKSYISDGELMARCQLAARKRFGGDAVVAFADSTLEAEALGAVVAYQPETYPHIDTRCLEDIHDWQLLVLPDPHTTKRMPVLLDACRILRNEVADEVLVVATVQGPTTLAGQLLGIEELIYAMVDQPEAFSRLLDFSTRFMVNFGKALIEAGAHCIHVFDPAASCSVINRAVFETFVLPQYKRAFELFKTCGEPIGWLNITGRTEPVLDLFEETGADLFNIDYIVPITAAMEKIPRRSLNGNLKPFSFISGQAHEITAEARRLLEQTRLRGGFILSPGCEIPLESKAANIAAMVAAATA